MFSGEQIPFTWHRLDFKNKKIVKESEGINTSSVDELSSLYSITKVLAKKVVALRKATGRIENIEDLRQIEGINKTQIEWLTKFTRA